MNRDTLPADSGAAAVQAPGAILPFQPGEVLGGAYTIRSLIGRGGMGAVYEAQDESLNRLVAIKVPLLASLSQRLRAEAQAMAALRHPNLVTVHAVGHHNGLDFVVMERLYGVTLEERIAEAAREGHALPLREVLDALTAVTDALTEVHRAGLAHRDVKASNVLVHGKRVVLTDFGLVTPEFEVREARTFAGSVDYMAPELIVSAVKPGNGPLVDLYALGVMAFELLTGNPPFMSDDIESVLQSHLTAPVPDIRLLRPDVPPELSSLIEELLAKAPEDRPESSEAVLRQLSSIGLSLVSQVRTAPIAVLVIDDQETVCATLKRTLQWSFPDLSVETATDPIAAAAHVEQQPPDIVVVNLDMPRMNGIELCMDIDALPSQKRPTVVIMSAGASPGDMAVLESLGIQHFVPKDAHFLARMRLVIGELCGARQTPSSTPPRPPGALRDHRF